jgi:ribosomal protein S12 methylthiotransferase
MNTVGIISLGCPRNLVDSEVMHGSLKENGFEIRDISEGVDICVVNTCGFIESAREESVDVVLDAAQLKKDKKIRYLVVAGCLAQLYKEKLLKKLPGIDLLVGTSDVPRIALLLKTLKAKGPKPPVLRRLDYLYDTSSPRLLLTPRHYAYVKISEGCDNACSYCVISRLRGRLRSRPAESIIEEVRVLSRDGQLKEINLIGQDTTLYGADIYGEKRLAGLLKTVCGLRNSVKWIRLLYTHPAHYTDDLISTVRDEEKICKYLDLPVQHISDRILAAMNRKVGKRDIIALIERLRRDIPGLVLRTSLIVGFPQETEAEFKELLDFVRQTRFERLGVFIYSREKGTPASKMKGHIPDKVKAVRFDEVMRLQQGISEEINKSLFEKDVDVLIEESIPGERGKFLGRTPWDAPEVDGSVYVSGKALKVGKLYSVKIKDTLEYDLIGDARRLS